MRVYECEINFNLDFINEAEFSPIKKNRVFSETPYKFLGIKNSPFKLNVTEPTLFLNEYMEYVVKNDRVASVVGSLYNAHFHDLVFDVDIKPPNSEKHLEIERSLIEILFGILSPVNPHIYLLAKCGGNKGIGAGLHIHIPNIVMSRLDNLTLTYVLKNFVDRSLINWSMPFSAKTGNIRDVYFPYRLYLNDDNTDCLTKFSKLDYFSTFGYFLYHNTFVGKSLYTFQMVKTDDPYELVGFIPILKSTPQRLYLGKNVTRILNVNETNDLSILKTFMAEHTNFDWVEGFPTTYNRKPLLTNEEEEEDKMMVVLYKNEFEESVLNEFTYNIYPLNIHDITNYVFQNETKKYILTYCLFYHYYRCKETDFLTIHTIGKVFQLEDIISRLQPVWTEKNHPYALEVLKILIFENLEPRIENPFTNNVQNVKKGGNFVTLSDLAVQLLTQERIPQKDIAPFLSPIVVNQSENIFYYMWNEWCQLTSTRLKDHLYNSKIKLFAAYIHERYLTRKKEDQDVSFASIYRELLDSSKHFWDRFVPLNVPKHVFPFVDGAVWDFKSKIKLTRGFPLWATTEKSLLDSNNIDFNNNIFDEGTQNLYFSEGEITKYPKISKYILQIMNNDVELADYLVNLLCKIVTGKFLKILVVFYGPTANNGKTTFMKILNILFGEMSTSMNLKTLHKGIESTNDDMKRASKARIVTVDEINQKQMINSMIVKVITGNSSIFVRGIYEKGGNVEFNGCLILAANGMPLLEISDAIISRFVPIPFDAQFPTDGEEGHFAETEKFVLATELFLLCADRFYNPREEEKFQLIPPAAVEKLKLSLIRALDEIYNEIQELGLEITHKIEDAILKSEVLKKIHEFNQYNAVKKDPNHTLNRITKVVISNNEHTLFGLTENLMNKTMNF